MAPRDEQARLAQWTSRLRELAILCEDTGERGSARLLLQAEDLLRDCPRALGTWFAPVDTRPVSARLMEAGAHVSFTLGLCSAQMSYLLSRSVSGNSLVTMALPELEQEAPLPLSIFPLR